MIPIQGFDKKREPTQHRNRKKLAIAVPVSLPDEIRAYRIKSRSY